MANSIDYGIQDVVVIKHKDSKILDKIMDDVHVFVYDKFILLTRVSSGGDVVRHFINLDEIRSFKLTKLKKD